MPNLKDLDPFNSPLKILLISQNGFGKTIALSSFHQVGPLRVEEFDGRMKPARIFWPKAENIDYTTWTSDNFFSFLKNVERMNEVGRTLPELGNFGPPKTWALDSVTSASSTSVVYQLKIKGKVKTTKGGLPATSWDEINGETVMFHQLLEAFKLAYEKFNMNIIWTCHPVAKTEIVKDEDPKKIISIAAYGNKIPSIIPGFFDEIHNLQVEKVGLDKYRYMVYTVPKEGMPGKTAFKGILPEAFDITDKSYYEVLMSYLKKGVS